MQCTTLHLSLLEHTHLNSCHKVSIVPCIDLSWPPDERCLGEHANQLMHQGAVGAAVKTAGENGGDVVQLGGGCQGEDILTDFTYARGWHKELEAEQISVATLSAKD